MPEEGYERLIPVGRWIAQNGEALYGQVERTAERMEWGATGEWTLKGNTAYYWCHRWPGNELVIAGLQAQVQRASLLATGAAIAFEQTENRLRLHDLPETNPDALAGVAVIKLECASAPRQALGMGCELL